MPRGRRLQDQDQGRPGGPRGDPADHFARDPDSLAGELDAEQLRLYRLIWQRALASQMAPKELETTTVDLSADRYALRATRHADGLRRLLRGLHRGHRRRRPTTRPASCRRWPRAITPRVREVTPSQHFTQPPPRYTEASLIKALEEHGIGRPSTYAATISTIIDRGYVKVVERRLRPEPVGEVVTDLLVEHFGEFVDFDFTARMEEELDEIAARRARVGAAAARLLRAVQAARRPRSARAQAQRLHDRGDRRGLLGRPPDGHPPGRNGRFLACSLYPEHKETRPLPGEEPEMPAVEGVGEVCPECGQGTLVAKRGRFGAFAGCSRYPDCKYIRKTGPPPPEPLPFEVTCPKCGEGHLVARRARRTGSVFWGCSRYPKCDFTSSREPLGRAPRRGRRPGRARRRGWRDLPEVRRVDRAAGWRCRRPAAARRRAQPGSTGGATAAVAGRGRSRGIHRARPRRSAAPPPDRSGAGHTPRDRSRGARRVPRGLPPATHRRIRGGLIARR